MSVKVDRSPADKNNKMQKKGGHKKAEDKLSSNSKSALKKKTRAPLKKSSVEANKVARTAIASGKVTENEQERKKAQDARTLYIRFSEIFPSSVEQIQELHSDIKFVRTPRLSNKKGDMVGISYAFLEFGDEESCKSAKNKLATTHYKGKELYVDFVGEKSKNKKSGSSESQILNPTRLFVVGLAPGVTKDNLKEMFPKAATADIPQKSRKQGTSFGFVQFSTAGDAKAAFDAAQDLSVNGHKITVLYSKTTEKKKEVQKKKAEKRKAKYDIKGEETDVKKIKDNKSLKQEEGKDTEDESEEDNDESGDDENLKDTTEEKKEESEDNDGHDDEESDEGENESVEGEEENGDEDDEEEESSNEEIKEDERKDDGDDSDEDDD